MKGEFFKPADGAKSIDELTEQQRLNYLTAWSLAVQANEIFDKSRDYSSREHINYESDFKDLIESIDTVIPDKADFEKDSYIGAPEGSNIGI